MIALEGSLLAALSARGPVSSAELQALTGKSQPTLSRALRSLGSQVIALGRGKATRYGIPHSIRGMAAQQTLWWTDARGSAQRWGSLTLLAGDTLHVSARASTRSRAVNCRGFSHR